MFCGMLNCIFHYHFGRIVCTTFSYGVLMKEKTTLFKAEFSENHRTRLLEISASLFALNEWLCGSGVHNVTYIEYVC